MILINAFKNLNIFFPVSTKYIVCTFFYEYYDYDTWIIVIFKIISTTTHVLNVGIFSSNDSTHKMHLES